MTSAPSPVDGASTKGPPPTCFKCKSALKDVQFVRVGDYTFHKEHFTCEICQKSLHGSRFHVKDEKFYCPEDFTEKFCQTCRHCQEKITTGQVVQALNGYYHPHHFVCKKCERPFAKGKYFEHEGFPFCEDHYYEATGSMCANCLKPIKDVSNRVCVQGKNYHSDCITCHHCKEPLARKGKIFQKDGVIYCSTDYLNFFSRRCTTCGDHITGRCVTVNDESYHAECLKCSICTVRLDKYICIAGHLRCSAHADDATPPFPCSFCARSIESDPMAFAGRKYHSDCFKCRSCGVALSKMDARLKGDRLVCQPCLMIPDTVRATTVGGVVSSDSATGTRCLVDSKETESPLYSTSSSSSASGFSSTTSVARSMTAEPIEWKKGELIGKGSFGKVYMAMNASAGQLIAVKQVRLTTSEDQEQAMAIQTEITLMENLRHPNIVALLGTQRVGNKLNILMEYVPGKSLDQLLEKFGAFGESVIRNYTKQLLEALAYCHTNHVVHRDIKGKNILVDQQGHLKLADFGSAKKFANVMSKDAPSLSYNYTPLWTAPEVLTGDYNSKVDIWSLGCVVIEMSSGKPPWSEHNFENPFRALYHIGNSNSIPKIPATLAPLATDFVKACLQRDPDLRPSADELLRHPFITGEPVPAPAPVPAPVPAAVDSKAATPSSPSPAAPA